MEFKNRNISVLHFITGLNQGGAEKILFDLVRLRDMNNYDYHIISLSSKGYYGEKFEQIGIPVHCLNLSFWNFPFKLFDFFKQYKKKINQT